MLFKKTYVILKWNVNIYKFQGGIYTKIMEMNLNRLLSLLVSKLKYIILIAVILAIGAFGYTKMFVDETYTSSAKFLVDMEITQNKASEQSFSVNALKSYMAIFNTRDFFNEVADIYNAEKGEPTFTSTEIRSMTSIADSSGSEEPTFYIKVTASDPSTAYEISKTISEYAVSKINDFEYLNTITMVESPIMALAPSSPNVKKNALIGFALGVILTSAFFVCREMFDGRIKNVEDISNEYDIPILGVVPDTTAEAPENKSAKLKKIKSSSADKEGI